MTQTLSIKDTRAKLADVVNQVAIAGDSFVITKFGQPKAMIIPIPKAKLVKESGIKDSFGSWKRRTDIKNSNQWAAKLRIKMSNRDE